MHSSWICVFGDSVYENYIPSYLSDDGSDVETFLIGIELAEF